MVETLKDDHHDLLNHHGQTFEDEEDENLHFGHITKRKEFTNLILGKNPNIYIMS
jgi:hypothetical protein